MESETGPGFAPLGYAVAAFVRNEGENEGWWRRGESNPLT